jgi:hypothetical protein
MSITLKQSLRITGSTNTSAHYGLSTAISKNGKTLVVGSPFDNNNGENNVGKVEIFELNEESKEYELKSQQYITNSKSINESLGYSVTVSDDGNVAF